MRILAPLHSELVQRAILHASARLVPAPQREEWLADWLTELWYGRDENSALATAFCRGALQDALWLRRNPPLPRAWGPLLIETRPQFPAPPPPGESRFLESPGGCLALLAFLAAVAATLALRLHTRESAPPESPRGLLILILIAWVILPATTPLSLGDYPANPRWLRRWIFLAAKLILIVSTIVLSATAISSLGMQWMQAGIWGAFWGSHMAMRWALADQRARCPVCLRRVAHPVRMGNSSRILLEWNGTELLCPRGHGLLHVPERPAIWFTKQRWLSL